MVFVTTMSHILLCIAFLSWLFVDASVGFFFLQLGPETKFLEGRFILAEFQGFHPRSGDTISVVS